VSKPFLDERRPACQNGGPDMTQVLEKVGAGEENRTLVISLEGFAKSVVVQGS
jgi:hypothetical protein